MRSGRRSTIYHDITSLYAHIENVDEAQGINNDLGSAYLLFE
jgi:hypothetical protein